MNIDNNFNIPKTEINNGKWLDPLNENVKFYGFNWIKENKCYNRLPLTKLKEVETISPKVAALSYNTAGGQLHFITNSSFLTIHVKISKLATISGMTFVGQGGFDCYVGKDYDSLQFFDSARFNIGQFEYEYTFFKELNKEKRLVVLNFPLYGCVDKLEIAVDKDSYLEMPNENLSLNNKIVYYGTSITQGGCASRPGLCYTNLLTRWMKSEIINFGFSGNAFGEKVIASIMASITDATMFIIDYEANGGTNGKLEKTLEEFIKTIRELHPITPIIVISRIKYLFDDLNPNTLGKRREEIRLFQENLVKKLRESDKHIYYINGLYLLGEKYDEYTIDSVHPNDLGFYVLASNLKIELEKILKEEDKNE